MKKIIIIGGLVIVIAVLVIFSITKEEKGLEVTVEKAEKGTVVQKVTGSGQIEPATEVNISATVSGKIIRMHAQEGDSVKKGQLLVELDREQYQANLQRAASALLSAIANEKQAKSDFERTKKLYEQKLVSQSEATFQAAEAQRQQMEASRDEARDQLAKTNLYSDMDGVVTRVNKEGGEMAIGATFQEDVIMVVSDLSVMESVIEVDENEVVNIEMGDSAYIELDAFPDTLFKGYVTEIANSAVIKGQGTQEQVTNFEVTVTIDDPDKRFRPGMSTTVDVFTKKQENVMKVPIQSVTAREKKRLEKKKDIEEHPDEEEKKEEMENEEKVEVVFIVENGQAIAKQVNLGISDDTHYAILSGLEEGAEVITSPFRALSKDLKNGDKVRIKE